MKLLIAAPAALLALAACGSGGYSNVDKLRAALEDKANIECPMFGQVKPSGYSAGHGSCSTRDGEPLFGMDVYRSNADRDKEMETLKTYPAGFYWCVAYGDGWKVTFSGEPDDAKCQLVADRLGGELKRSAS